MNLSQSLDKAQNFEKTVKNILIILFLSFVGWLVALYSLWHRQSLFSNGLTKKSFCNINSVVDCDSIAFSSYSSIFGIPTAAYGMFFCAVVFVISAFAYFAIVDKKEEELNSYIKQLLALSTLALVPTLFLAGISFLKLNTLCILCLASYLVNLGILFFSWQLKKSLPSSDSSPITKITQPLIWSTLVLLLLHLMAPLMVTGMVASQKTLDEGMIRTIKAQFAGQTPVNFDLSLGASFGPENATITLVEFSDFQCPFCAISSKSMPLFLKGYQNKIRYVYKFYPLDSTCNSQFNRPIHSLACYAAKVGYCVQKAKGDTAFFSYKELVFDKQSSMTTASILNDAVSTGLNEIDLKTCVDDPGTQAAIQNHINEAIAAKIEGTPAIFINGRKVESGPNLQVLSRIIEDLQK
jgi:protein-disulfide isomerase/uncharacterized membrane protein